MRGSHRSANGGYGLFAQRCLGREAKAYELLESGDLRCQEHQSSWKNSSGVRAGPVRLCLTTCDAAPAMCVNEPPIWMQGVRNPEIMPSGTLGSPQTHLTCVASSHPLHPLRVVSAPHKKPPNIIFTGPVGTFLKWIMSPAAMPAARRRSRALASRGITPPRCTLSVRAQSDCAHH